LELDAIVEDAQTYFLQVLAAAEAFGKFSHYSDVLTDEHKARRRSDCGKRLATFGKSLLSAAKNSPLLEQTDESALKRLLRGMSASLSLNVYEYHEAYIISDEYQFHDLMPASQDEREADFRTCEKQFFSGVDSIPEKMDLIDPSPEQIAGAIVASQVSSVRKLVVVAAITSAAALQ
jgi:hypothetical protein